MLIDTLGSSVLFLEMTGLSAHSVNPVTWYLSSMLLCMGVLYPLVRRFRFTSLHFVACLILLGTLHQQHPEAALYTIRDQFFGIYTGNIRAFCGMSFGMYVFALVQALGQYHLSPRLKTGVLLLKWGSASLFIGLVLHPFPGGVPLVLLSIAVLIGTSFLTPSQTAFLNSSVVAFLGKLSLPLYLSNFFYSKRLCVLLVNHLAAWQVKAVYYVCSITTALLIMWAAQWFRHCMARRSGEV